MKTLNYEGDGDDQMTTEIARTGVGTLPERIQYAKALAEADLLPQAYRRKPGNVLLAVEYGNALGVPPMTAIQGINVIAGKPTLSADLMAALVRRAGHKLRVKVAEFQSGPEAIATLIRSDDPEFPFECHWDMDRAKRAGLLGKDNWTHHPAAMLKARAISEVVREGASEVLHGMIYTAEELGADVDDSGNVVKEPGADENVVDGEIVKQPEPDPLNTAKQAVVQAWEVHRGKFDQAAAAGVFGAWSEGEVLSEADGPRLEEFARWLASDSEDPKFNDPAHAEHAAERAENEDGADGPAEQLAIDGKEGGDAAN